VNENVVEAVSGGGGIHIEATNSTIVIGVQSEKHTTSLIYRSVCVFYRLRSTTQRYATTCALPRAKFCFRVVTFCSFFFSAIDCDSDV
jgi:hypothetical protein